MKAFLLLLAFTTAVFCQFPDITGTWVSDSCEKVDGATFFYFRTYDISADGSWSVTANLYTGDTCGTDKLAAIFFSEGTYVFTAESNATECYGSGAKVYDIQFWSNKTKTLTPKTSAFASTAKFLCSANFTVDVEADVSSLSCSTFQLYSPCPDGEFDIISVLTSPTRFYNGKRGSKNQCQEDNRPTILSPNAVKLNGDGISTTPLRCELTAPVPVAAPQAAPSAAPNAPGAAPTAVPKSSNANATSAASILLFAALLFV